MIHAVTVYFDLDPKFGLIAMKHLAFLGAESYLGCILMHGRQEHSLELRGALAPRTSPRLEVALLVAWLRGQQPESECLSQLCLQSTWIRGTAGDHEVSEDRARKF